MYTERGHTLRQVFGNGQCMDVWPCTLEMKTAGEEASSGHRNDDGPSHSWPAWPECAAVWPNRFPNLTKLQLSYPKRGSGWRQLGIPLTSHCENQSSAGNLWWIKCSLAVSCECGCYCVSGERPPRGTCPWPSRSDALVAC